MTFERLRGDGAVAEVFGEGAAATEAYELLTVDVPPRSWTAALTAARDTLGCTFFDWLSAVDEPGSGFHVVAHVVAVGTPVRRLLLRTLVPAAAPELPTAVGVYAGAAWHERETHEMFGIGFPGHPGLDPLLLPEGFEGYPLRKEFVLAARVVKEWPGAKEPEDPAAPRGGGARRRQPLPPGVPDPNEWGPRKGTLGPAADRAADPEPPRRGRTAGEPRDGVRRGEAGHGESQHAEAGHGEPRRREPQHGGSQDGGPQDGERPVGRQAREPASGDRPRRPAGARGDRPRRNRSVSGGSASQTPAARPTADAPWQRPAPAQDPEGRPGEGPRHPGRPEDTEDGPEDSTERPRPARHGEDV